MSAASTSLFDEPFYERINEARWAAAQEILDQLRMWWPSELKTCLDAGCGTGWFAQRLSGMGLDVHGLDGRADNLRTARARVPGAAFHHADIESALALAALPSYDLVLCFGLLYHTENPFRVVRNLRRLCGRVLLVESRLIPGDEPLARLVAENDNETQGLTRHALIPSRSALIRMLQAAPFAHVYEWTGQVPHEDFQETVERHRARRLFVASDIPLDAERLRPAAAVDVPKYSFAKSGNGC